MGLMWSQREESLSSKSRGSSGISSHRKLTQGGLLALIQETRRRTRLGSVSLRDSLWIWDCSSSFVVCFDLRLTSHVNNIDADSSRGYLVPCLNPGAEGRLFIYQPQNKSLEAHSLATTLVLCLQENAMCWSADTPEGIPL